MGGRIVSTISTVSVATCPAACLRGLIRAHDEPTTAELEANLLAASEAKAQPAQCTTEQRDSLLLAGRPTAIPDPSGA